jgi:hypothetical protein
MSHCINCGERVYRGLCTNCHEENFIEQQYIDLEEAIPEQIYKIARENEINAYLKPIDDNKTKDKK